MRLRPWAWCAGAAAVLVVVSGAHAGDRELVGAYAAHYSATEVASSRMGSPEGTQGAYDAARDLQEAVRAAAPVGGGCRALAGALARYAGGRVLQAEGYDRPSSADIARGRRVAEAARAGVTSARASCAGARSRKAGPATVAISPTRGEAFFGAIVARAPAGAREAQLYRGTTPVARTRVRAGRARFNVGWGPGRYDIRVVFRSGSRQLGAVSSHGVRLLPASALRARPGTIDDAGLTRALTQALSGGPRYRAAWVQGISSGRVGQVNADALFPAASTVKLGLMVGVLVRLGSSPADSPYAYDLRAIGEWSSNLANNRLVRRFGSSVAADGLRRLGAQRSTFTGEYIVGTELQPQLPGASAVNRPPQVSQRVTTARDLGRMLMAIHASAVSANARGHTGLTQHQARLALGWLLASQQRADNAGLFAGAGAFPAAQKNGWLNAARLGAAVLYPPQGPVIAVLVTYDESGVSLARAQQTGARVARVALGA